MVSRSRTAIFKVGRDWAYPVLWLVLAAATLILLALDFRVSTVVVVACAWLGGIITVLIAQDVYSTDVG